MIKSRRLMCRGALVVAMTGGLLTGLPMAEPAAFADSAPVLVNLAPGDAPNVEHFIAPISKKSLDLSSMEPISDQSAQNLIAASGVNAAPPAHRLTL